MKINILSPETINRIAAGEVVERPASIVKELVENAIDAGSTHIAVSVKGAGSELITVIDNGEGMEAEDLGLAVRSHTTSKIATDADLQSVSTLGFRGEALASIAAVSRLSITTRTRSAVSGQLLVVNFGQSQEISPAGCATGTRVTVEDLFANTPARKKFLKKPATELAVITEVLQEQILAQPGIRFSLHHNNRQLLNAPGSGKLEDAVASVAGLEIAEALLPCTGTLDGWSVQGFLVSPRLHRSNRQLQFFTVNKRPIASRMLSAAVEKAYHTLLPVHRYPMVFLNIKVPIEDIDVNVHPTKREVKFSRPDQLFRLLFHSCMEVLAASKISPLITNNESTKSPWQPPISRAPAYNTDASHQLHHQIALHVQETDNNALQFQILGQVFSSYIVVSTGEELVLVDQHAAQERVMYERYIEMLEKGEKASQIVIPVETKLPAHLYQYARSHMPALTTLGFDLKLTDDGLIVREVPLVFKKVLSPEDVMSILTTLNAGDQQSLGTYSDAALMLMACKSALKANQRLSVQESRQLINDLASCKNKATCPHGRPITVSFNRIKMEKMFARR